MPEAVQLAITVGDPSPIAALTDGSHNTSVGFSGGTLTITAEEEIAALYLKWEDAPGAWFVRAGDTETPGGADGFLHEYVELAEPSRELTLQLPGSFSTLTEVIAFSAGIRPDWVQIWQRRFGLADLLVVSTHSDDEFVFMGGLIPSCVARGLDVQVCYIVHHNDERDHEVLDSLWAAGVRDYPVVSNRGDFYCRSFEEVSEIYGEAYMTGYLVEQIRHFKPLVVVAQDENGEYGHWTHIFGVYCLKNALELAGDAEQYPESAERWGIWDVPKTYLHLYGEAEKLVTLDYETPLESFGGRTAFEVACDAFEYCVSQVQRGYYRVYGTGDEYDSHLFGLYRSLVGEDEARNDLFEHIE